MRALIYIMTPVLILTVLLASRFVTWDRVKGENREALAHVHEGTQFLRTWQLPQAIAAFTQAIEIDAGYAEAYVKRGLAYYRSAQYETAIADYTQTLTLNRYHADAYASRGDAYRALGDAQRAITDYTAALEKRWDAAVMLKRATLYQESRQFSAAFADYDAIIQRRHSPQAYYGAKTYYGAQAYYARGNAYLNTGKVNLALADMNEAIALEPGFAYAYIRRAHIYEKVGQQASEKSDYVEAIKLLTEAIQGWQGDTRALIPVYYWRAFAYQQLGEIDKARDDAEAANKQIFKFFLEKFKNL